jgi:protein-disulfide isomerase
MTVDASPGDRELTLAPLDENVDHVRGSPAGRLIIEYGDYECPYSRQAFHAIEQVEEQLGGNVRFAFRHFPLTRIHPHALAAAAFDRGRAGRTVLERIQRDVDSGLASGQVLGTPTLFIDGVVHRRGYDPPTLLAALAPSR